MGTIGSQIRKGKVKTITTIEQLGSEVLWGGGSIRFSHNQTKLSIVPTSSLSILPTNPKGIRLFRAAAKSFSRRHHHQNVLRPFIKSRDNDIEFSLDSPDPEVTAQISNGSPFADANGRQHSHWNMRYFSISSMNTIRKENFVSRVLRLTGDCWKVPLLIFVQFLLPSPAKNPKRPWFAWTILPNSHAMLCANYSNTWPAEVVRWTSGDFEFKEAAPFKSSQHHSDSLQ